MARGVRPAVMRAGAVLTAGLAVIAGALSVEPAGQEGSAAQVWPASPFAGSPYPGGMPVPDVALRDEDGAVVHLAEVGGPAVVTFGSAVCEETCPLQAQTVRGALDDLGLDLPAFIVSVDPARDTPERARRFLARQRLTGRVRFLLGPPAALRATWRGFAVAPQTAREHHQARIVLTDGRGRQRVGSFSSQSTPETVAHDLRLLEREPGGSWDRRVRRRTPTRDGGFDDGARG